MSGGWTPSVHLFSQSRGKLRFDTGLDAFVPGTSAQAEALGRQLPRRRTIWRHASMDGAKRPAAARLLRLSTTASFTGFLPQDARIMPALPAGQNARRRPVKAFVDFQNDVTAKDLKLAVREGFESIEHVKRYTTTGMATDQGKTSNMNALGLVAGQLGREIPAVGTTTFRLPYTPVTFGSLAGPNRGEPVRSRARDADPRLGGRARCEVRGRRVVEARLVFPGSWRRHGQRGRARDQGGQD